LTPFWRQKQHLTIAASKNRAMKIPRKQDGQIRISLRVSPKMHEELLAAAEFHGRTLNNEVMERIKAAPINAAIQGLYEENAEIKAMLRELLAGR
jgi:hypothetical protein